MKSMWAIRHKPTNHYLPSPKGHSGRGGSFVDPVDPDVTLPRLFPTERSAKAALTCWLKGKHEGKYDWDDSEWGGMYKYCIGYIIVPVPNRKREDMEVVEIVLQPQLERTEP